MPRHELLAQFWVEAKGIEVWDEFLRFNDLALPYALGLTLGHIDANENTARFIDQTWNLLCRVLDIPADREYDGLEAMMELAMEAKNAEA